MIKGSVVGITVVVHVAVFVVVVFYHFFIKLLISVSENVHHEGRKKIVFMSLR